MNIPIFYRTYRWLLQATTVQCFLTLISLPILVAWGLPLSYVTPVGTLLFTPLLTAYLWCALAVFTTTLCAIPNQYCIYALQHVSDWWLWILGLIKTPWQIGFVCPPIALLICIPISAFALVYSVRGRSLVTLTANLVLLLSCWVIVLRLLPQQKIFTVQHTNGKSITALYTNNHTTVIDCDSCCSSMIDSSNWIAYHALPTITQQTGAAHIDQFIVIHPRQRTFEALATLVQKGIVRSIQVPYWDGHIPRNAWFAYKKLQEIVPSYGYTFDCIPSEKCALKSDLLTLKTARIQKYGDATYQSYTLHEN